jgi:hypothetical protein
LEGLFEAPAAEIIGAALHQDGGKFIGIDGAEERNVLFDELFLEGDCVSRDNGALLGFDDVLDDGKEIGEGLSNAGTRFDHQVVGILDGIRDGVGHFNLLGAEFVQGAEPARNGSIGAEDRGNDVNIRHRE